MSYRIKSGLLIVAACLYSLTASAAGPAPRDIADLVGARASGQCVQMATADGRAADVRNIYTHPACR